MSPITRLILNTLSLSFALFMNYWVNTGAVAGKTIGELSRKYQTLITPSSYAFSIWGLIFLLLLGFVAYQWYEWLKFKKAENIEATGWWFVISSICNGLWTYVWLQEQTLLSVAIMLLLLFSLIQLTLRLRLEIWDAPLRIIAFVWWPICLYLGWVLLATVVNISATLVSLGWQGAPLSETFWTVALLLVATVIYLLLIRNRNMREAALVGVWGFVAIALKQQDNNSWVMFSAWLGAAVLFIAAGVHAYRNKDTSPLSKIMQKD